MGGGEQRQHLDMSTLLLVRIWSVFMCAERLYLLCPLSLGRTSAHVSIHLGQWRQQRGRPKTSGGEEKREKKKKRHDLFLLLLLLPEVALRELHFRLPLYGLSHISVCVRETLVDMWEKLQITRQMGKQRWKSRTRIHRNRDKCCSFTKYSVTRLGWYPRIGTSRCSSRNPSVLICYIIKLPAYIVTFFFWKDWLIHAHLLKITAMGAALRSPAAPPESLGSTNEPMTGALVIDIQHTHFIV